MLEPFTGNFLTKINHLEENEKIHKFLDINEGKYNFLKYFFQAYIFFKSIDKLITDKIGIESRYQDNIL